MISKFRTLLAVTLSSLIILSGCASQPPEPVSLTPTILQSRDLKVGVAMTAIPQADTHQMGADCLLCAAAAATGMAKLTKHVKTLPSENLPQIKDEIATLLKQRGVEAIVIPDSIEVDDLPKFEGSLPNAAARDYSAYKTKYGIDKLIVIDIQMLGTFRTYAAYVPTSDPKGVIRGAGYLVDLSSNSYDWYLPLDVTKASNEDWDEPPSFPGLTNAYFQAIEIGRATLEKPFTEIPLAATK